MAKKVLILGASGMLGHTLFFEFMKRNDYDTYGTVRSINKLEKYLDENSAKRIITGIDAFKLESIGKVIEDIKPDVVINCIGVIKQLSQADDPLVTIPINSLLPHQIASLCEKYSARMVHISTDCVFDGKKGSYTEDDFSNATDLYGRTKYLGEVNYPHAITLRTSIIGHEISGAYGLVEWFLAQKGKVKGFTKAIYTGFPTIEIFRIIADYVISNEKLSGLYQVSSESINKYDLLKLIAGIYDKDIEIEPYGDIFIDRSLNSERFRKDAAYKPPSWADMVKEMYDNYKAFGYSDE